MSGVGYHVTNIERGEYGELSKVLEEVYEAMDAESQGSTIMFAVELADIYGALEEVALRHNLTMADLKIFSDITKRAFINGVRK